MHDEQLFNDVLLAFGWSVVAGRVRQSAFYVLVESRRGKPALVLYQIKGRSITVTLFGLP